MIPNPYDEWVERPEKDYSYEALVESYRQFAFSPAARALVEKYEADALREAITTALQKADARLLWLSVVSPLRGVKTLRNESTEEARRIWAFVDKAAASAETPPGTKRN